MYKAVGFWTWPNDEEAFEEHYRSVHVPAAEAVPGITSLTLIATRDTGRDANIYRIAEMAFDDEEAFARASQTPEWARMIEDATAMIERFGVEMKAAMGYVSD